jgi:hypothetical protein
VRPLSGVERMRALGFPERLLPSTETPFSPKDWELVYDSGDCIPLPAIVHILRPLADHALLGRAIKFSKWDQQTPTWSSFFTKLGLAVPPIHTSRPAQGGNNH